MRQSAAEGPRLLADVGGTNARFAWQAGPGAPLEAIEVLSCADYPSLQAAIEAYLAQCARPRPTAAGVAMANPVVGDWVQMTNHHWSFSIAELQRALGLQTLLVRNDFAALAMALPSLSPQDRRRVGGGAGVPGAPMALIGPGTGLGVSGLLPDGRGGWIPVEGEGGHVTLCAVTPQERVVVEALQRRFGHASAERAISGMGLRDLYRILAQEQGLGTDEAVTPAWVSERAREGDRLAQQAIQMLCAFLGTVAGNLALTLGARGGVYIGGGVVPRLGDLFDADLFRERFEAKGRFRAYLAEIPVWVITADPSPALQGMAAFLDATDCGILC